MSEGNFTYRIADIKTWNVPSFLLYTNLLLEEHVKMCQLLLDYHSTTRKKTMRLATLI
jgi:hypothetical protein